MKTKLVHTALALAACSAANAAIIAYEGFNYTEANGTSISGLNGGTGWTEGYPAPSGTIALDDGLSFAGHFASVGKSMKYGINANLTTDGRNWSATVADGTYWYSMLVNPQTLGADFARGVFNILQNTGDNQNGFGFRLDNNAGNPRFRAHVSNQATGANIDFTGYNQTFLVLGKLTVNIAGSSTSDLWVYNSSATLPTSDPGAAMSSFSFADSTLNAAISGRAFSNSAPIGYDEIRIGTSFADVMVIPEPSSAVFGLLGLGALLRRRRH